MDLLRLQRTVLRRERFFETLPVHSGLSAARHFWWGTYLLMLLVACGFLKAVDLVTDRMGSWEPYFFAGPVVLLFIGPPMIFGALMFVGCLAAQFRYGIRDYRVSAVACYYGSPYLWPAMACFLLGSVLLMEPSQRRLQSVVVYLTESGYLLTAAHLAYLLLSFVGAFALVFALRGLGQAVRMVRYANV